MEELHNKIRKVFQEFEIGNGCFNDELYVNFKLIDPLINNMIKINGGIGIVDMMIMIEPILNMAGYTLGSQEDADMWDLEDWFISEGGCSFLVEKLPEIEVVSF